MKLALGTVQFGLKYGIANKGGQVSFDEASAIITSARNQGITTLDTASAYGTSQKVLGQIGIRDFRVVTKVPPLNGDADNIKTQITASVMRSLDDLNLDWLYGVLLHQSVDLSGETGGAVFESLSALRNDGLVRKIGVSIYDPEELDNCRFAGLLDLVQAPYNVFDQRLRTSGWLTRLKSTGTEIHTRSAFLQGLLLADPTSRPPYFQQFATSLSDWDTWVRQSGLSPVAACLYPLRNEPAIDQIVVGVDSAAQLDQITGEIKQSSAAIDLPDLACPKPDLIDPRRWPAP